MRRRSGVAVGVDVGGRKKGFHGVAVDGGVIIGRLATRDAMVIVEWCRAVRAAAVGVDAPCHWSRTGGPRFCERELARAGLSSFATPSLSVGRRHPFYGWMLNGAQLFRRLARHYPLYDGRLAPARPLCFETFPHAIACSLAGRTLAAKNKLADRRIVLQEAGIDAASLRNIDEVDAALCAVAAQHLLAGSFRIYGDESEGVVVVPTP